MYNIFQKGVFQIDIIVQLLISLLLDYNICYVKESYMYLFSYQ